MPKKPESYILKQEIEALIKNAYDNNLPLAATFLSDQFTKPTKEDYIELCRIQREKQDYSDLLEFDEWALSCTFNIYLLWEISDKDLTTNLRCVCSTKERAERIKKSLEKEISWRKVKNKIHIEKNIANHPFGHADFSSSNIKKYYIQGRLIDGD